MPAFKGVVGRACGVNLARRFPALKDEPIVETRVCQLEVSVDQLKFAGGTGVVNQ